ncbi:MAG: hypothetical protein U0835_23500 [Isosphaeraceae bacterium]
MIELVTIRRVTVYATAALEQNLISHFLSLGANGYSVTPCRGKGEHAVLSDPMTPSSQVRIELIVQPAVADKILMYLQADYLRNQAVAACVEDVRVAATERF